MKESARDQLSKLVELSIQNYTDIRGRGKQYINTSRG